MLLEKPKSSHEERHLCSLFPQASPPVFSLCRALILMALRSNAYCISSTLHCSQRKPIHWDREQSQVHVTVQTSAPLTHGTRGCWSGGLNSALLRCSLTVSYPAWPSFGRESEAWQSPALSLWSSPLSFKLLQMCGESGHGAALGRDSWLTGCRVLNLPFNNCLMNPSLWAACLLPLSLQTEPKVRQQIQHIYTSRARWVL